MSACISLTDGVENVGPAHRVTFRRDMVGWEVEETVCLGEETHSLYGSCACMYMYIHKY